VAGKIPRSEQSKQKQEKPQVGLCDDLRVLITQHAFERYQTRGGQNGFDLDDRFEAEQEVISKVPPV